MPLSSSVPAGVLYFLPMLYIAWSDEVLTPTELSLIQGIIEKQTWLTKAEKEMLRDRLDPQRPPKPSDLKAWLKLIRGSAVHLPEDSADSILDLSLELASLGTEEESSPFKNERAAQALRELEMALGIRPNEAMQEILTDGLTPRPHAEPDPPKPGFSVANMQALLDGPHAELKNRVKNLLLDPAFSYDKISSVKEVYRETVLQWLQYLADQGLGALHFPDFAGGENDMEKYIAVFETLGYHDHSLLVKFGVQFGLFGGSILQLGTEYHHHKYLKEVGSLALPGCFAMTEADHGSNVRDIETTAVYDPQNQEFIINTPHYHAHKEYIGNAAAHGKMATVFAQLETKGEQYGVHALLVPIRDDEGNPMPGVTIKDSGRKLGLNGVDNGRLWFNQVRIPRENLLNRFADVSHSGEYSSPISSEARRFFTMLGTLVGGRICVPLAGLSATKSGLAIAVRYASQRRQFGPPGEPETLLLDYHSHQMRLIPRLAKTYALHFAHRFIIDKFLHHTEEEVREIEALAAGLKAVSTWHTTDTLQEVREACGGNGYLWVNRFADLKADTEIYTTFEGDNTVLLQLVAKSRLSEFKQEFSSMKFWGMVRYLGGRISTELGKMNPIAGRNTDESHLRDPDFLIGAFRYRETELVQTVASRLKKRLDRGMNAYDAFLEVQTHLLEMAQAYIDRIIITQFHKAIKQVENKTLYSVLEDLFDLYALSEIQRHIGWYQEENYIESPKAKAIRKLIEKITFELRDDALALVDAFGIPDGLLGAPIARM
jgi:acyl-CoA oxidase